MSASFSLPQRRIAENVADVIELLGSMRFAVSLLVFICLASLIGTVLPQNGATSTYIDQFGPFWVELFDVFALAHVYSSPWFLAIMGFLVVSVTLCLIRSTPKMLREARTFREHIRLNSLRAFPQAVECRADADVSASAAQVRGWLQRHGYRWRTRTEANGVLLAAKKGGAGRLGYVCAHSAIVLICVGGLADSALPLWLQVWWGAKQPVVENMLIADVPASGKLSVSNPSFRANVLIAEGSQAANAVVLLGDGALVQPLPFQLRLNRFNVEYYSTGMPRRFASEVEVIDPKTGARFERVIAVNEPLRVNGVTVYQSSFDDGGSRVALAARPVGGAVTGAAVDAPLTIDGVVGQSRDINLEVAGQATTLRLDVTDLRVINVEDMRQGAPQPKALLEHVASVTGSAAGKANEHLRNIGPSITYRLTDAAGQSHEFHHYMLPVTLDDMRVFLFGVRNNAGESFRYLRIPADDAGGMDEFLRLRATLADPAARVEAARRFAQATAPENPGPLRDSALRALDTFSQGGLQAIAAFLEANVGEDELPRAAQVLVRLLELTIAELHNLALEQAGLALLSHENPHENEAAAWSHQWSRLAVAALSDLTLYPAPVLLTLTDFQEVKASVFQVTRTPGQPLVYLGCLLLVLGVFAMLYVRERRIWVWLKVDDTSDDTAGNTSKTSILAAMTAPKRSLDFHQEFARLRRALHSLKPT